MVLLTEAEARLLLEVILVVVNLGLELAFTHRNHQRISIRHLKQHAPCVRGPGDHSWRSASTGFSLDARHAGWRPLMTQVTMANPTMRTPREGDEALGMAVKRLIT